MDNKLITGIIGVVVVVALLGSALVPVIDGLTEGEKTTNEGAGWIRMDYVTGANYDANVCFDPQGNIRVDAGVPGSGIVNTQTHAADEDTILFASSELSMWLQDGVINILGKDSDGNVFFDQITEIGPIATVMRDGTGSQFSIDTDVPTQLNASSWAYVPKSTGNFGFFDNGTEVTILEDVTVPIVGAGFAGVYGYNDLLAYDVPFRLQTTITDNVLSGATWVQLTDDELNNLNIVPFDPSQIVFDPSIIDLDPVDPGAQLMGVPTPTYTDGDWGFNLVGTDAKIVSYSGPAGDIVIPSTVTNGGNTYTVKQLGINSADSPIFDNASITGSTITIPSTVTKINDYAFDGCSGFTGSLVLPDGLQSIGLWSFRNCSGFTGSLVLPDSVTYMSNQPFIGCSGFDGTLTLSKNLTTITTNCFSGCSKLKGSVIIPASVNTLSSNAFNGCSGLKGLIVMSNVTPSSSAFSNSGFNEVLDLSETIDYSVNRYGISNSAVVQEEIGDAIGYVSFVEIGTDAQLSGGAAALLIAVPVVVIAGLLVAFVGYSIVKRY